MGTDTPQLLSATIASMAGSLTDEQGRTYATRVLESTLPGKVAPHSSVAGTLVFEPVPANAKKLVLTASDVQMADRRLSLNIDLVLGP